MFFIYNKYDKNSNEMLRSVPPNTVMIDLFTERDAGNYLDLMVSELPVLVEQLEYVVKETQTEIKSISMTTDTEQIMQMITDSELHDMNIKQNQELLAQQMTDIELTFLGGDR